MADEIDLLRDALPGAGDAFQAATLLGDRILVLALGLVVYWCFRRREGLGLLLLLVAAEKTVDTLKDLLAIPRPDPAGMIGPKHDDPSFPSGHAARTATLWFGAGAVLDPARLILLVGTVVVLVVALSRVYLGVHRGIDVVAGSLLGVLLALVLRLSLPKLAPAVDASGTFGRLAAGFLAAGLALLVPSPNGFAFAGFLVGVALGHELQRAYVPFEDVTASRLRVARGLAGGLIVGGLDMGLMELVPLSDASHFGTSLVVALAAVALVPAVFRLWEATPDGDRRRPGRGRGATDSEE